MECLYQSLFQCKLDLDFQIKNLSLIYLQFQSLFQWKLDLDKEQPSFLEWAFSSFNPCFSGSCSLTIFQGHELDEEVCFNPCFSGSCALTMTKNTRQDFGISFNPCFSGSCALTETIDVYVDGVLTFQSLFQWKLRFNPSAIKIGDITGFLALSLYAKTPT